MLTLFTTAKSFVGDAGLRQKNAIASWRCLDSQIQILLFGEGEGYADVVDAYGLEWVRGVQTSESGCPRIDSMFRLAGQLARFPVRAYLNCDIILMDDVLDAIECIPFERYLMVSQRRNLAVHGALSESPGWMDSLRNELAAGGVLDDPSAIDMFLYRGEIWSDLPPLVVGRGGYDNLLVFSCRRNRIPVVDVTDVVTLIHQKHDYSHLKDGAREVFGGKDALANLANAGNVSNLFTIVHADWRLTSKGLVPNRCRGDWKLWARSNRSLLGNVKHTNSSWRALLVDCAFECWVRCQSEYPRRPLALAKYPFWVILKVMGGR